METCRTLYTIIWNNNETDPNYANLNMVPSSSPTATFAVCHGDHWHIQFFASMKNVARKMTSIVHHILSSLNRLDASASVIIKCSITRQIIRNPLNFMHYLVSKYNGHLFLDENDSQVLYLYNIFISYLKDMQNMPGPSVLGDCGDPTTIKRASIREQIEMKKRSKFEQEKSLFDMFKSMDIRSEEQFMEWLKTDESQIPELWARHPNWEKKLKQYVEIVVKTKRGRFDLPFYHVSYLEAVMNHECNDINHDTEPTSGAKYLLSIFQNNGIDFPLFLNEVENIIRMKYPRINALVIRGPTTTGKTLIAKNIVKPYNYGSVSRDGDATAFYLQNLLDHDIALMEEPHISMTTVQNFKELLAGSPLMVQVKNHAPRELGRIPCIITTNQALWDNLIDAEAEPIKKRIIEFKFYKPITFDYVPIICYHSWKRLCAMYLNKEL